MSTATPAPIRATSASNLPLPPLRFPSPLSSSAMRQAPLPEGQLFDIARPQGVESRAEYSNRLARGSRNCVARCAGPLRSEEHTSELQSLAYLVCRLLL